MRGLAALRLAGRATLGVPAVVMTFTISLPICWAARTELPSADSAVEPVSRVASVTPPSAVASVPVARVTTPVPAAVRGRALLDGTGRPRVDTDPVLFFPSGFGLEVRLDVSFLFFFLVAMALFLSPANAASRCRSGLA